jgi:hypothetical protein
MRTWKCFRCLSSEIEAGDSDCPEKGEGTFEETTKAPDERGSTVAWFLEFNGRSVAPMEPITS